MKNRRMNKRYNVAGRIDAVITYSDNLKSPKKGVVNNISSQGLFMDSDTLLDKNAYVNLKLDAKKLLGKPLRVQGFVVRTNHNGMGIQFTHTEYDDITAILSS